ncbi:MAG: hypothetical protein J0H74_00560 [Chitinophagaceae bacterium]|nr:hypothetical protein [Chitinophagaceae bacterium]
MNLLFTLCSNNYLAQAKVLADSARQFQPDWTFLIGLVDKKDPSIPYQDFGFEIIEVAQMEPRINILSQKYSILELSACVKPSFFEYLFGQRKAERVIYMDPDTLIYSPLEAVDHLLSEHNIVLTPHILSPIPMDGLSPDEPLFLNYGLYNLGFLALKKTTETLRFLRWWRERTYQKGYDNPARGLFTDQLWINFAPLYFEGVAILKHPGYNMGPWNLHERSLRETEGLLYLESGEPLVFYHFSGFKPAVPKLHYDYTRFTMEQRVDLQNLYRTYEQRILQTQYTKYSAMPCHYVAAHQQFLAARQPPPPPMPYYQKKVRQFKDILSVRLKKITSINLKTSLKKWLPEKQA